MNTQTVKLDVTKRPAVMPVVYLGQGDKNGTTLVADIYDNGAALTLTGYTVKFQMKQPHDAGYYNVTGTVSGSTATFAIDENYAAAVAGVTECAYVEVLSGSTVICSTNRMRVVVLEGATEGVDPSSMYDNGLNDAISRAITAAEAAEGVVLQDVPTMTENVKGGAKLGSGLEVTSSVLSLDLVDSATGTSITADDASYLEGLTIEGKAVQNGTPTPSSPVPIEVVDGINMMKPPTNANTSNGVTFTPDNSGHIALANTATGAAYCDYYTTSSLLALEPGTYTVKAYGLKTGITIGFGDYYGGSSHYAFELTPVAPEHTLTISENKTYTAYIKVTSGTSTGVDVYVQLEKGSTATPYIPYGSLGLKVNSTITPIDLQGNVLASLPDGTKDELTVDSAGHKVIKKRVVYLVYDGSEDESWAYESAAQGNFYIATVNDGTKANSYGNMMMCNYATPTAGTSTTKDHVRISSGASHYLNVALGNSLGINTAAGFKTWLATHNLIVLAPLETEQTIDLGYIDPPAIPDGAAISITAQVTPTITASWWARGAAAIASAIKALRDDLLARIEAIETAIADL